MKRIKSFLLFIILIFSLFCLSSCGNWGEINTIQTEDRIVDKRVEIPLSLHYGYQSQFTTYFATDLELSQLKGKIESASSNTITYSINEYPSHLLIKVHSKNDTPHILLISEENPEKLDHPQRNMKHAYIFTDFVFNISIEDKYKQTTGELSCIFPYHLVSDLSVTYNNSSVSSNLILSTSYTIEDFTSFYNEYGACYQINSPYELQGNTIILCQELSDYKKSKNKSKLALRFTVNEKGGNKVAIEIVD